MIRALNSTPVNNRQIRLHSKETIKPSILFPFDKKALKANISHLIPYIEKLELAQTYIFQRQYQKAIQLCTPLLKTKGAFTPKYIHSASNNIIAQAHLGLGNKDKALRFISKAVRLNTENIQALLTQMQIQIEASDNFVPITKNMKSIQVLYKQLPEQQISIFTPVYLDSLRIGGIANIALENYEEGKRLLEEGLSICKKNYPQYSSTFQALLGKFQESKQALTESGTATFH